MSYNVLAIKGQGDEETVARKIRTPAGDRRSAPKSLMEDTSVKSDVTQHASGRYDARRVERTPYLEDGILDFSILANLDLKLHHITTCRCAHQACQQQLQPANYSKSAHMRTSWHCSPHVLSLQFSMSTYRSPHLRPFCPMSPRFAGSRSGRSLSARRDAVKNVFRADARGSERLKAQPGAERSRRLSRPGGTIAWPHAVLWEGALPRATGALGSPSLAYGPLGRWRSRSRACFFQNGGYLGRLRGLPSMARARILVLRSGGDALKVCRLAKRHSHLT